MKPKHTPEFQRGYKAALMRVYGLNTKWTSLEIRWRKAVLNEIQGKKRKR